jgi:hypothetical protein
MPQHGIAQSSAVLDGGVTFLARYYSGGAQWIEAATIGGFMMGPPASMPSGGRGPARGPT